MSPAVQALVALAEAERGLVADGAADRAEELAELAERRDHVIAMLPAALDPDERVAVARAVELQEAAALAMQSARDGLAAEMRRVDHGRRTARGYAPAGLPASGSLSLHG